MKAVLLKLAIGMFLNFSSFTLTEEVILNKLLAEAEEKERAKEAKQDQLAQLAE
jgi:hypothetical protein